MVNFITCLGNSLKIVMTVEYSWEDVSAMPSLGPMELVIVLITIYLLPVVAFWKICSRVGFSGALGLLMIVPIANAILPLYVAFAKWPAFEQRMKG